MSLLLLAFAVAPPAPHPVNTWVRLSPHSGEAVPGFVYEGSGGYDPFTRRWIHHAGHDGIPQGFHTFTFDPDTRRWRQELPPTSPPGACCVDGGNAFDAGNRLFLRFPGGTLGHGFQFSRGVRLKESAVWAFDPVAVTWTNMRPPPYALEKDGRRTIGGLNSAAAYDPNHEVVFNFGGQGSGGEKNTLFVYDAYANALKRLDPPAGPSPRDGMGLAYDTKHDRLVMFGSQYTTDERTWLYDLRANRWEGVTTKEHPPGGKVTKEYHCIPRLAYDPLNDVVLCVAWLGEKGHETWSFDVGTRQWTKMNPSVEPTGSKSRSRNLDFDAQRNVFILETSNAKTNRPEMWTYRYRTAKSDPSPAPPSD